MRRLYFVAVIPDEPIHSEVTRFKEFVSEHFDSIRALRSPPHITLFPPFRYKEEEINEINNILVEIAQSVRSFSIEIDGFAAFKPRVIFVNPILNQELSDLQKRVEEEVAPVVIDFQPSKRPFHPHMTIAFKDLRKSMFWKAWEYFQEMEYRRTFEVRSLYLLKHNKRRWEIEQDFPLGNRSFLP